MGATTTSRTPHANARRLARQARVQAIRDGALVRRKLGQGAIHERLSDGLHVVIYRGRRFTGPAVDAAIQAAREGGE